MPEPHLFGPARLVLAEVAARLGVPVEDAQVIHRHSNLAVMLPSARLLVRIAGTAQALERVRGSVRVTRWLADRGYPCVDPVTAEPFVVDGHAVSVWRLLDVVDYPPGTADELGRMLRALHDQPEPPFPVRFLTDPLASVAHALQTTSRGLAAGDRDWLTGHLDRLRHAWSQLTPALPAGLVHGDAHTNNLIRLRTGEAVLGDWDHAAHGPREWDLIQPYYMARRLGRHTSEQLDRFAEAYGWDVRTWDDFETMIGVREASGLSPYIRRASGEEWSRDEAAHRVATLRSGDSSARWHPPVRQ